MHITTTNELEEFCRFIENSEFITIDTEFFREVTYYPKLCIIQIANNDKAVIIDALNKNLDLSPLNRIFQNKNIVKVFHSGKQDLEIIYNLYGELPKNIFDTQIAASFCGFGSVASYESLVHELFNEDIDKSYCISDWSQRPLEQKQIDYAIADVTYLRGIYKILLAKLKETDRYLWAMEDIDRMNNTSNFIVDHDQVWRKIKNMNGIRPNVVLQKLAGWREEKAKECNLPRNHYLNEIHLFKLMKNMPITVKEVRAIPYFKDINNILAEEITSVIQNALSTQLEEDFKNLNSHEINIPRFSQVMAMLKALLDETAKKYELPNNIIATSLELKTICNTDKKTKALTGWRYEIFGHQALENKAKIVC